MSILAVFALVDFEVAFEVAIRMQSRRVLGVCEERSSEGGDEMGEAREMGVHPNVSVAIHRQNRPTPTQRLPA
jgi:hypothetical protein